MILHQFAYGGGDVRAPVCLRLRIDPQRRHAEIHQLDAAGLHRDELGDLQAAGADVQREDTFLLEHKLSSPGIPHQRAAPSNLMAS